MGEQEHTSTQDAASPGSPAPGTPGPGDSATQNAQPGDGTTGSASSASSDNTVLQARIAELETQSTRYQSNIKGWEQQSQRHLEENEELKRSLAQTQEQLRGLGVVLAGGQIGTPETPKTPADAIQKFLDGDDTAVNTFFGQQQPNDEERVRTQVNEQLTAALAVVQRQQIPFAMHPELADTTNAVRKDALETYDVIAADPNIRMMHPDDPNMLVQLPGPDGQPKTYDIRLLDRAAVEAKQRVAQQQGAAEERTRQSVGDVLPGSGTPSAGAGSELEASELFTERELQQFADPAVLKSLPAKIGRDLKSIAQYLYEDMSEAEKQRRLVARQARGQTRTA